MAQSPARKQASPSVSILPLSPAEYKLVFEPILEHSEIAFLYAIYQRTLPLARDETNQKANNPDCKHRDNLSLPTVAFAKVGKNTPARGGINQISCRGCSFLQTEKLPKCTSPIEAPAQYLSRYRQYSLIPQKFESTRV